MSVDPHQQHIYLGEPEEDLIRSLEPDQLVSVKTKPVPRKELGTLVQAGLWALRVFVIVVSALVIYAFAAGVIKGGT
jgi:hypothetical protein